MLKIVAKNFIKEDKIDEFITLAKGLVEDTRKNDAGCIRYELVQDLKDPTVLTILEEWESQEALDAHMNAEHFKKAYPRFGAFCEKPGEVNIYKTLL